MINNYCIITTTCATEELSQRLITSLLDRKMAACVQVNPIHSFYIWKGKMTNNKELLLTIKTKKYHYTAIEQLIIEYHDYEVPEIVMYPIEQGSKTYLDWIEEVTL